MKTILIIIGAAVLIYIIKSFLSGDKPEDETSRPSDDKKPSKLNPNDKLVLVKNVNHDDLKKVLIGFCNMYNKESYLAMPRLTIISTREFVITFPYDIYFETYCYFVNYLYYPMEIEWKPNIIAWTTTENADEWIKQNAANKKVMLFVPEDDEEHDNVFMTTEDNIGYMLGFAIGEIGKPLNNPKKRYSAPTIDIATLADKKTEDFQ